MAKNTGRGSPGVAKTATGVWMKRNASTGKFLEAKKTGGAFKGVHKESCGRAALRRMAWIAVALLPGLLLTAHLLGWF